MKLGGVCITINAPDDEYEADVPSDMTVEQLCFAIRKILIEEEDMTSFVIAAAVRDE